VFFDQFPDRESCWGDSFGQNLSESKMCVFFVQQGDCEPFVLKLEHKNNMTILSPELSGILSNKPFIHVNIGTKSISKLIYPRK